MARPSLREHETTRVLRHATGRKVHVRATVGRTTLSDGGHPRVLALLEDLAGRLAADTGRSVAERALQEIVDTTADAFVSLDRRGRVVDWNAAATALFGYDADETIGRELALLVIPEQR